MESSEERSALPEMPRGAWQVSEADAESTRPEYASWGARAGALIIDNLILAIPWALAVVFLVAAAAGDDDGPASLWVLGSLFGFAAVVLPFVYFTLLHGSERGQTLGKRVAGIRVRRRDGSSLGTGRALGRYALTFVFGAFLGPLLLVDYLWPLWDADKQTLHDKAVDSIVIRA